MKYQSLWGIATVGAALSLFAGSPIAAVAAVTFDSEMSIAAVSDANELEDMLAANQLAAGARNDADEAHSSGNEHDDDTANEADSDLDHDMESGSSDARQAEQDANEATQEDSQDDRGASGD